jgi:hypothetical protein
MEASTKLVSANHSNNQPLCRFTFLGLLSQKWGLAARRIKLPVTSSGFAFCPLAGPSFFCLDAPEL